MKVILEPDVFVEKEEEELMVKLLFFGLKKRRGNVYTQVIRNC